jgi:hypothetical protein
MTELESFLVKGDLCPKLQHNGTCKFSWKESKVLTSNQNNHIKN